MGRGFLPALNSNYVGWSLFYLPKPSLARRYALAKAYGETEEREPLPTS
jgi:hypothetical protein